MAVSETQHLHGSGDLQLPDDQSPADGRVVSMVDRRQPSVVESRIERDRVAHDIRHELATIRLLASLLCTSSSLDEAARQRALHIADETRWIDELVRASDVHGTSDAKSASDDDPERLDLIAEKVIEPIRLSSCTQISLHTEVTYCRIDRLAFWRVLRNLVTNALEAVGASGRVSINVRRSAENVLVDIDDDGPGLPASNGRTGSLGLSIVRELVATWGGVVEFGPSELGGCRVRLILQAAEPAPILAVTVGA